MGRLQIRYRLEKTGEGGNGEREKSGVQTGMKKLDSCFPGRSKAEKSFQANREDFRE
jgi:hypothetical protein